MALTDQNDQLQGDTGRRRRSGTFGCALHGMKACSLQRPVPDGVLKIIASGEREERTRRLNGPEQPQEPLLPL